jgi:hypothetical protein
MAFMSVAAGSVLLVFCGCLAFVSGITLEWRRHDFKLQKWQSFSLIGIVFVLFMSGITGALLDAHHSFEYFTLSWFTIAISFLFWGAQMELKAYSSRKNTFIFSPYVFPVYRLRPDGLSVISGDRGPAGIFAFLTMTFLWGMWCSLIVSPSFIGMWVAGVAACLFMSYILSRPWSLSLKERKLAPFVVDVDLLKALKTAANAEIDQTSADVTELPGNTEFITVDLESPSSLQDHLHKFQRAASKRLESYTFMQHRRDEVVMAVVSPYPVYNSILFCMNMGYCRLRCRSTEIPSGGAERSADPSSDESKNDVQGPRQLHRFASRKFAADEDDVIEVYLPTREELRTLDELHVRFTMDCTKLARAVALARLLLVELTSARLRQEENEIKVFIAQHVDLQGLSPALQAFDAVTIFEAMHAELRIEVMQQFRDYQYAEESQRAAYNEDEQAKQLRAQARIEKAKRDLEKVDHALEVGSPQPVDIRAVTLEFKAEKKVQEPDQAGDTSNEQIEGHGKPITNMADDASFKEAVEGEESHDRNSQVIRIMQTSFDEREEVDMQIETDQEYGSAQERDSFVTALQTPAKEGGQVRKEEETQEVADKENTSGNSPIKAPGTLGFGLLKIGKKARKRLSGFFRNPLDSPVQSEANTSPTKSPRSKNISPLRITRFGFEEDGKENCDMGNRPVASTEHAEVVSLGEVRAANTTEEFWLKLNTLFDDEHLLACGLENSDHSSTDKIVDVRQVEGMRLLKVQNTRDASDEQFTFGSVDWTPRLRALLGYDEDDESSTWLTYQDLMMLYDEVYIFRNFDQSWYCVSQEGLWSIEHETAGGCNNFSTVIYNPQLSLTVKEPCNLYLVLQQEAGGVPSVLDRAGLYVADVGGVRIGKPLTKAEIVSQSGFLPVSDISTEFSVTLDENAPKSFTVIPATYLPGKEARFTIKAYAKVPLAMRFFEGRVLG